MKCRRVCVQRRLQSVCGILAHRRPPLETGPPDSGNPRSLLALLLVPLGAFAPALEAVNRGGQEEAGHDGHHGHGDPREDDDEQVRQRQGGLALAEAVLGQLAQGHASPVHGKRALHVLHACVQMGKQIRQIDSAEPE